MRIGLPVLAMTLAATLLGGCARGGVQVMPATSTPGGGGTASSSPTATAAASALTPAPPTAASGASRLVSLNGMRCVGQWRNATMGTSGAFATRIEAGGSGGAISFEVGGPVFGGSGGVFEAPFRLVGDVMEVDSASELLGHVRLRIPLDGKATGVLTGMQALGPNSSATITDYTFADNRLTFSLRVELGGGRRTQTSSVEAACSR